MPIALNLRLFGTTPVGKVCALMKTIMWVSRHYYFLVFVFLLSFLSSASQEGLALYARSSEACEFLAQKQIVLEETLDNDELSADEYDRVIQMLEIQNDLHSAFCQDAENNPEVDEMQTMPQPSICCSLRAFLQGPDRAFLWPRLRVFLKYHEDFCLMPVVAC